MLRRLIRATGHSLRGLAAALRHEQAFREEVAVVILMAPAGLWLGATGVERALLLGSLMAIPTVELLNSAVEAVVDRMGPESHPLAGRAKDMGSAAVFLAIANAGLIWFLVLGPFG